MTTRLPTLRLILPVLVVPLAIVLLDTLLFAPIFHSPALTPEDPEMYFLNADKSFVDVLRAYNPWSLGWYRPTQFFLSYWVILHFIGWHDILGFKVANFLLFSLTTLLIALLARRVLRLGHVPSVVAAAYFAMHPAVFLPLNEVTQFDFLHIIFMLLSAIAFNQWICTGRWGWWLAGGMSYIGAVTCKEVGLGALFMLPALGWLHWQQSSPPLRERWRSILGMWSALPLLTLLYLIIRIPLVRSTFTDSNYAYRIRPNVELIIENAVNFVRWMPRILTDHYWWTQVRSPFGNGLAYLILAGVVATLGFAWRDRSYRIKAAFCLVWIAALSVIPVYSGGFGYHILDPMIGYALLVGLTVDRMTAWRFFKSPVVRYALPVVLVGLLIVTARRELDGWLSGGLHAQAIRVHTRALHFPPIPPDKVRSDSFFLIDDDAHYGLSYYGYGHLFAYVYERPSIHEDLLQEATAGELRQWLTAQSRFCVRVNPDTLRFEDKSADCKEKVEAMLEQKIRGVKSS